MIFLKVLNISLPPIPNPAQSQLLILHFCHNFVLQLGHCLFSTHASLLFSLFATFASFTSSTRCKLSRCITKTGYTTFKLVKQATSLISQIRATLPCREMRQKSPKMRPNWVKMRPEDPHFVCAQLGHDGRVRGTPCDCNPLQLVVVVCKIHQDRTNKHETLNNISGGKYRRSFLLKSDFGTKIMHGPGKKIQATDF